MTGSSYAFWLLLPLAAASATALLVILLRPLLQRYALARPNARSSHRIPTPQGGGIAVIAAIIGVSGVALITGYAQAPTAQIWPVFAATAFLAAVGAFDDIHSIAVMPRLALQALAVALVVAALPAELRVFPVLPWGFERALILLGGLYFINLVNFMDGIDWMTVVEVVPVTLGLVIIGMLGALPEHGIVVALALCGAMLGFAPFNRPVASLFLGDVGSLPIGLLLGWLLTLLAGQGHLAAALLLPLYYLADATLTLIRRAIQRDVLWEAHRTHFYQRATDRGATVMSIVGRVFLTNGVLVALAILTVVVPSRTVAIGALAAGAMMVALLLYRFIRGRS